MFSSPGMWAAWRKFFSEDTIPTGPRSADTGIRNEFRPDDWLNDTTVMLSERIRSEWPTTRDSRFWRARRTAFNSRVLIWSKASSFEQTPDTWWGWRTAPHPWPDASVVMTNGRGRSSKRLPFEKARRRGPRHAQHLDFWTQGNKLVLRVDQGSEIPQKMKLKRPHQQPAVGNKVHEAGKVAEKFLPQEGGRQRTLGKIPKVEPTTLGCQDEPQDKTEVSVEWGRTSPNSLGTQVPSPQQGRTEMRLQKIPRLRYQKPIVQIVEQTKT